jgi:CRP-like cAMP-binding protein
MLHRKHPEEQALADELAELPVFAGLPRTAVEALVGAGRVVHLPTDWALLTESQPADSCYVLLGGTVEVRQHGAAVATLRAGSLVGEAALVEHRTRNASVITSSEVRALRLGFDEVTALFAAHPALETAFRSEWTKHHSSPA